MRVLLIYPPATLFEDDPTIPGAYPPLGLAYIAAVLKKVNISVGILDALAGGINTPTQIGNTTRYGLTNEQIKGEIIGYKPNIVGISNHFTAYSRDAHTVARLVKEISNDIKVVMGGNHVTATPDKTLEDSNVDMVIEGEGEQAFLDVVSGKISPKGRYRAKLIEKIDNIPWPARELLPMNKYFNWKRKVNNYDMRHPNTPVVTSRGCPRQCTFCSVNTIWGNGRWRSRSAKSVVDEIEMLKEFYFVEEIQFVDDNLTLDKQRITEICEDIIRRKLNIRWCTPNGVEINTLDKKLIKLMRRSGCYRLSFGIESANKETQEFIGKRIDLDHIRRIVKWCKSSGIWTIGFFIIGFPFEQYNSIQDTINFACRSGIDYATFYLPMPFPGTKLFNIMDEAGYLKDIKNEQDYTLSLSATRGLQTKYFDSDSLQRIKNLAYKKFMKERMWKGSPNITSLEDIGYNIKIIMKGIKILTEKKSGKGYRPIGKRNRV